MEQYSVGGTGFFGANLYGPAREIAGAVVEEQFVGANRLPEFPEDNILVAVTVDITTVDITATVAITVSVV